jgi:hypothetical protein
VNAGREGDPPNEVPDFGPDEDILTTEIREGEKGRREKR